VAAVDKGVGDVADAVGRPETPKRRERVRSDMSDREMGTDEREGRFVVTHADEASAVLKDVDSGQVHTLAENPGIESEEVIEGVVAPEPPMEVSYRLVEVEDRRRLPIEESPEPPTRQEREIAAEQAVGEVTTRDRAGTGELHVLTVPDGETEAAVEDVRDDEATLVRAARLGVDRVEIRSDAGVVCVRYLP
jgi:hypothetical protein